jgi:membrane-bound lytic murein transglycosylase B
MMLRLLPLITAALFSGTVLASTPSPEEAQRAFIDRMSSEHGFQRDALNALLAQAKKQQSILDAIARPAEAMPWWRYRKIFLTDARAEGGAAFWAENEAQLKQAADYFGVAPEIIVAIIGVETFYGRHTGKYRVIDALSTLGFHYPKRGKFFRSELGQFLLLTREEGLDPTEPLGSYAGALGRPQFISSSYRNFAVDFDGDGKRDIWHNNADVIGSVANYFARHGWQRGADVVYRAEAPEGLDDELVQTRTSKTRHTLGELRSAGVEAADGQSDDTPASLFTLEEENGESHWVGLKNFYVITRYNHSNLYAMAVYQLSRRILALRQESQTRAASN